MIKKITWSLIKRIEIMGATKKHTPPMTLLFMKGTGPWEPIFILVAAVLLVVVAAITRIKIGSQDQEIFPLLSWLAAFLFIITPCLAASIQERRDFLMSPIKFSSAGGPQMKK